MSANLMAAAVKRSGRYNYKVREQSATTCTIEFFERNGQAWESIGVSTFTAADAQKAQTQNMDKFPRNMLFSRAMSNGVKWFCPDVTGGPVYTPDELGANVDDEGNVTGYTAPEPMPTPQPSPVKTQAQNPTDAAKFEQAMAQIQAATDLATLEAFGGAIKRMTEAGEITPAQRGQLATAYASAKAALQNPSE